MKISKITTLVAAVVATSVISVAAFAADNATLPQQKVDFGANVALAGISGPSMDSLNNVTGNGSEEMKKGSLGYGAFIGYGYQIMPQFYLGAELGYQDNGHTKYTYKKDSNSTSANVKIKSRMATLLATADYFVTPNWDFVGKFGPAYVWQKVNVNGTTTLVQNVQSSKTHKVAPYLSLGTGYHFDNNVSLNIAYDHLFGSSKGSLDMAKPKIRSVNAVQLTVGYTLPF